MENDAVVPAKLLIYKHYVDKKCVSRKKSTRDMLFKELCDSYHQNINLTLEINPLKFLDTKLIRKKWTYIKTVSYALGLEDSQ